MTRSKKDLKMLAVGVLAPATVLAVVLLAQKGEMPSRVDLAVRASVELLGLICVPLMMILAYRAWSQVNRTELPRWRNGLGSASMTLTWLVWLSLSSLRILRLLNRSPVGFLNLEWLGVMVWVTSIALVMALALKGPSRPETLGAALLMLASLETNVYA